MSTKRKGGFCTSCGEPIDESLSTVLYVIDSNNNNELLHIHQFHHETSAKKTKKTRSGQIVKCVSRISTLTNKYAKESSNLKVMNISGDSSAIVSLLKSFYPNCSDEVYIATNDINGFYNNVNSTPKSSVIRKDLLKSVIDTLRI